MCVVHTVYAVHRQENASSEWFCSGESWHMKSIESMRYVCCADFCVRACLQVFLFFFFLYHPPKKKTGTLEIQRNRKKPKIKYIGLHLVMAEAKSKFVLSSCRLQFPNILTFRPQGSEH